MEPAVSDRDLDALIQAVMKAVDEKSKETEEARARHAEERARSEKSKTAGKQKKAKK